MLSSRVVFDRSFYLPIIFCKNGNLSRKLTDFRLYVSPSRYPRPAYRFRSLNQLQKDKNSWQNNTDNNRRGFAHRLHASVFNNRNGTYGIARTNICWNNKTKVTEILSKRAIQETSARPITAVPYIFSVRNPTFMSTSSKFGFGLTCIDLSAASFSFLRFLPLLLEFSV